VPCDANAFLKIIPILIFYQKTAGGEKRVFYRYLPGGCGGSEAKSLTGLMSKY
jgi:hypothetical protein